GRAKPGFSRVLEDGEQLGASIFMIDSAPRQITPSATSRNAVDQARRAWMADKSTAYRNRAPDASPVAAGAGASSRPPVGTGATPRRSTAAARRAWLADKETAYRGSGE